MSLKVFSSEHKSYDEAVIELQAHEEYGTVAIITACIDEDSDDLIWEVVFTYEEDNLKEYSESMQVHVVVVS